MSCRGTPRTLHCEDAFVDDAHGIMQIMVHYIRAGFEADDQTREYVHEAALLEINFGMCCAPNGRGNASVSRPCLVDVFRSIFGPVGK